VFVYRRYSITICFGGRVFPSMYPREGGEKLEEYLLKTFAKNRGGSSSRGGMSNRGGFNGNVRSVYKGRAGSDYGDDRNNGTSAPPKSPSAAMPSASTAASSPGKKEMTKAYLVSLNETGQEKNLLVETLDKSKKRSGSDSSEVERRRRRRRK
jgi:hypothetical protein